MFRLISALGAATIVGACGLVTGEHGFFVSSPGRFAHLSCEELAKRYAAAVEAEKKQIGAMERAMEDPAGFFVNFFVYSSPLASQRGELHRLEEQAKLSNCDLAEPKTAGAASPG